MCGDACACKGRAPCAKGKAGACEVSYTLFAFRNDTPDDGSQDLTRRRLPREKLGEAVLWAIDRGMTLVHLDAVSDVAPFRPPIIHHLCSDPGCPGGC